MTAVVGGALEERLAVFKRFLDDPEVEDVCVNRPNEVFVNRAGTWSAETVELSFADCFAIGRLLANYARQTLDKVHPQLNCTLPTGERVALCIPPMVDEGTVGIAIRRQVVRDLSLDQLSASGLFEGTQLIRRTDGRPLRRDDAMEQCASAGDCVGLLKAMVRCRRNIAVGGGTGAGKTTLMNAIAREFPEDDRIVTIEDVREVKVRCRNHVALVVSYDGHAVAQTTADSALRMAMRMIPDRVLLGECRGSETTAFLRLLNSGHPGSLTSVHADDAETVFWKLAQLAAESTPNSSHEHAMAMAKGFIDVSVFVEVVAGVGRRVREIHYV